jgi:hypothetical protein
VRDDGMALHTGQSKGLMWVGVRAGEGMRQAAWSDRCLPIPEGLGEQRDGRDAQRAGPQPRVPLRPSSL